MDKEIKKIGIRHGDVIIIHLDNKIKNIGKESDPVLALGEVSCHSHRLKDFSSGAICDTKFDDSIYDEIWSKLDPQFTKANDKKILKLLEIKHLHMKREGELIHEEHLMLKIPPGDHAVIIQREWQETGWAKVLD